MFKSLPLGAKIILGFLGLIIGYIILSTLFGYFAGFNVKNIGDISLIILPIVLIVGGISAWKQKDSVGARWFFYLVATALTVLGLLYLIYGKEVVNDALKEQSFDFRTAEPLKMVYRDFNGRWIVATNPDTGEFVKPIDCRTFYKGKKLPHTNNKGDIFPYQVAGTCFSPIDGSRMVPIDSEILKNIKPTIPLLDLKSKIGAIEKSFDFAEYDEPAFPNSKITTKKEVYSESFTDNVKQTVIWQSDPVANCDKGWTEIELPPNTDFSFAWNSSIADYQWFNKDTGDWQEQQIATRNIRFCSKSSSFVGKSMNVTLTGYNL